MNKLIKHNNNQKWDVVFWADLQPSKKGSFEDFICHLAEEARERDLRILFVLGNEISKIVNRNFEKFRVDYWGLHGKQLLSKRVMYDILRRARPKIIHFHFIPHCSNLILFCRLAGYKNILYTDHNSRCALNFESNIYDRIKYFRRKFHGRLIKKYICVSNFVAECLQREMAVPQSRIKIIYNGVDSERFTPLKSAMDKVQLKKRYINTDANKFVVSYVGQIIEEKGLHIFLDAARKTLESRKDVVFLIIGDGKKLEEFTTHNFFDENIKYYGLRDDIEVFLKITDLLICPSTWSEAFGLILAEAAACGIPVVASKVGGIPEVVRDLETGVLIEPNSANELRLAIGKLLNDALMRRNLGIQARSQAMKQFTLNQMVTRTLNEYFSLM